MLAQRLFTLQVVFAHFFKPGVLWIQLLLVASTIPIAIFVNSFRVALTGLLAHQFGEKFATGAIHDFQGIFTFSLAFFILLGEGRLIDFITDRSGHDRSDPDLSGKSQTVETQTS